MAEVCLSRYCSLLCSEYLRDFDPFKAQKEAGFFSSLEAMSAVGEQVVGLTREGREISCHKEQLRAEFEHLLMVREHHSGEINRLSRQSVVY